MVAFGIWVRDFILNLVANIAASVVSPTDMIGYAIALVLVLVWIINWHRKRIAGGKRGVDSWYFIALALVVASVAIARSPSR
jgi:archaellum biogenesis protein FlaJ (TadC family)